MFCRRAKVRYCAYNGASYQILPSPPTCYVKKGKENIGYFEGTTISASSLHINHFAVDSSITGEGKGERMLRGFAALIKVQCPSVSQIIFDLGRSTANSNIQKLAQARVSLFQKIGAINIQTHQPNGWCLVASATWSKSQW
ncbi:hypothetical protein XAC3562_1330014 [Xanthomonas citri pv. citri]|uniref:Uncharacterized protein n=1 Tax=Xanthomonas citri pv. citri TaxID=611301 RepID=A0A0U5F9C4_XANCI|nr:hypothetical protein XAC3562_1330014 [Xanthomonas citri pv. citri]CEH52919.1 hypothetical protein XACLD7_15540002 [Xanthomonas citri pv. citri]CEH84242.1 hypothetical protein XACLH37_3170004 [Xanthomonas citri pv. citri]CEH87174.1 hypothetical protein XAC3612_4120003 [Xanthomonas citri pv. citri]CEJ21832.1 hypothetical protein XACE116_13060003 [Xanthomonas citri pv. citri]